jgi:hypothetical protein
MSVELATSISEFVERHVIPDLAVLEVADNALADVSLAFVQAAIADAIRVRLAPALEGEALEIHGFDNAGIFYDPCVRTLEGFEPPLIATAHRLSGSEILLTVEVAARVHLATSVERRDRHIMSDQHDFVVWDADWSKWSILGVVTIDVVLRVYVTFDTETGAATSIALDDAWLDTA